MKEGKCDESIWINGAVGLQRGLIFMVVHLGRLLRRAPHKASRLSRFHRERLRNDAEEDRDVL
jgi:hypothetical protein